MGKKVTIGGNRLGSGSKMTEELHGYGSSTHDLGYVWKSSMTSGTLVPFMVELMTNGDHATIDLDTLVRTHPTVGAMFGTFKMQLDVFKCPIRYYNKQLHNNQKGIGLHMENVYFPTMTLVAQNPNMTEPQPNQQQFDSSSLLSYLGIRGIGSSPLATQVIQRVIPNAVPLLAYWDIYANYYANLQEEIGVVVSNQQVIEGLLTYVEVNGSQVNYNDMNLDAGLERGNDIYMSGQGLTRANINIQVAHNYGSANAYNTLNLASNEVAQMFDQIIEIPNGSSVVLQGWNGNAPDGNPALGNLRVIGGNIMQPATSYPSIYTAGTGFSREVSLKTFPIENIDIMRDAILSAPSGVPYSINTATISGGSAPIEPYASAIGTTTLIDETIQSNSKWVMAGLGIKTYQSDRFNNWLSTEFIDGSNGVNEISSIDVSDGTLTMDSLNLQQKIYNLLNRIILSGGSYRDWQEAVYSHRGTGDLEIPEYCGGASSEIVFSEVVSTADAAETLAPGGQPLGTLGGRGIQTNLKKNLIKVTANEPCYLIGLVSITPRLDYSQGNKWIYELATMNDLHKPELDGIGYQDLITEEMAAWSTRITSGTQQTRVSAGKQPAWIQYTTNVNQAYGNFADGNSEAYMVLGRKYEHGTDGEILDLTTYIDPNKFNNVFAIEELSSQHFWVQVGIQLQMSRVMATTQIPQL